MLVIAYTLCGLTQEGDKLIAFNGIARWMEENVEAAMTCGMWEQYIVRELQWEVCNQNNRVEAPLVQEWRAPSWSWASGDHHLTKYTFTGSHGRVCPQSSETAEVTSLNAETLPTGKVVSATLTLRGEATRVTVRIEKYDWKKGLPAVVVSAISEYRIDRRCFVFDRLPAFPYEEELTLVALSKCHCVVDDYWPETDGIHSGAEYPRPVLAVLMLRRLPTTSVSYSRVGMLRLAGDECQMYDENKSSHAEELVLV